MVTKQLSANALPRLLEAILRRNTQLVAPVEQDGLRFFRPIQRVEEIVLDEGNTAWSFKEFLFPRTEPLFHYRFEGPRIELVPPQWPDGEVILFGARPCDAAGLAVLDKVYSWDYKNDYYHQRRERTTIVAVSCAEPDAACFCTAVGLSPTSTQGSDVLLTKIGDSYLAEASTEKGERFLANYSEYFTEASLDKADATRAAEARIQRAGSATLDPQTPLEKLFDNAIWNEVGSRCLGCGACAFICPTCHCFDIVDEADARGGSRCKNWDACGFALFTLHTSGHNPRPDQPARVRQRVLHKLRYFPERFGIVACVGCGRCVRACPANVDIYETAMALANTR